MDHDENHLTFDSVHPATLVPQPGPKKERPQVQLHFICRVEHKYYYYSTSSGDTGTLTLTNQCDETRTKIIEFDQCMVFFSPDEFCSSLSRVLLEFGIREDHDVLQRMATEIEGAALKNYAESWGKRIFAMEIFMTRKHDVICCKNCRSTVLPEAQTLISG